MNWTRLPLAMGRWLARQPGAWMLIAGWWLVLVLERRLAPVSIAPLSHGGTSPYNDAAFQAVVLGGGLGLAAVGVLRPLWTRQRGESDTLRCLFALSIPVVLFLLIALPTPDRLLAFACRESVTVGFLLVAGCALLRCPVSSPVRLVLWFATCAACLWLLPGWFSLAPFPSAHPLGVRILPIVGLMIALWLSAPHRSLDR